MAMSTARWAVVTGVITRIFRNLSLIPPLGQVLTQTPQPRQRDSSIRAFLRVGLCGSPADTSPMASTGQAVTHLPQPLHKSALTSGRKFVVAMGFRTAKRLAASIASQQHPQQLHMNATFCCTFSPNCTRLCSRASSSRSIPSFASTLRAMPCLISDWAVVEVHNPHRSEEHTSELQSLRHLV